MDFSLSEDQQSLKELALKIIGDHATHERLKTIEASPEWFDRKLWEELARASLLGVSIPEEYGGGGLGFFELCLLVESTGRHCVPIPVYPTLVLGALPLAKFGSVELKARHLPAVAAGTRILTGALVDTRSEDPLRPAATATPVAGGWKLRGTKMNVPMLHVADAVLLTAATPDGGVLVALLETQGAALRTERQETTMGEPQFLLHLDGVRVPDAAVIGTPAKGRDIVRWLAERATAALCAMEVGVTERALRMTAEYTSTREQFGRPLSKFQAVAQRAADAFIDVEAIRWTAWQAIWLLDQGRPAAEEVAIAKFWVGEGGHRAVYAAQHLHGGIGVDLDYPLFRSFLWSKQIELTLGPATAQLAKLGAMMAGSDGRAAAAARTKPVVPGTVAGEAPRRARVVAPKKSAAPAGRKPAPAGSAKAARQVPARKKVARAAAKKVVARKAQGRR